MSLNHQELTDVIAELRAVLAGSLLTKLNAPDNQQVQLVFRHGVVLVDLTPGVQRLHLTDRKRKAPATPPGWVMKARRELAGKPLENIHKREGERIVRFDFGGGRRRSLLLELFGRGRLLLLDERDRILAPLLGRAEAGQVYQPPEGKTPPESRSRFGRPDPASLAVNRAVSQAYERLAAERTLSAAKRGIDRRLSARVKRLRRRIRKMETDQLQTQQAERLSRQAEALKLQLGSVRRGQTRALLPEPSDPDGKPIEVELDPALSPVENMNRMFSRARRLLAARGPIGQRINGARRELQQLTELSAMVAMADSPAALEALQPGLAKAGADTEGARPGADKKKRSGGRRVPYRMYHSVAGKTILVGRSGADNHELTFRVARGTDLWLHTRDAASAHVVVRLDRGEDTDEQTLLDAATLAAHHSPLKSASKVEVTYTRVKNVRPIKGAPPGRVSLSKSRTLLLRMEPERIKRLQQTRR